MNETIGNRIAKFRKEKGLTQEDLAGKLGISSQAVSKWETDVSCPDISLLPQLSALLSVTTDELLTGKNDEVKMVPASQRKSLDELTLRMKVNSVQGDKVRVNLPMSLVKVAVDVGVDLSGTINGSDAMKKLDLHKILALVDQGALGKLVEIESAGGDTVEVVVE